MAAQNRPTVFVANRGEIAVRIVNAARRIGAKVVVGVSEADKDSLAAQLADDRIVIGPAQSNKSYLNPDYVAQAALNVGADVVHPGYGFLSEQPKLVELLEEEGIAFAGPRPETIKAVGDKASARVVAEQAGVPLAPARNLGADDDPVELAETIGFPLLIKAVYGGGGRGIRLAQSSEEVRALVPQAAAEAQAAFGNGELYLERYYPEARHVEVQVFGDGKGRAWIFGDRDCSVQRRHQKLIEECPAPGLTEAQRTILHDSARSLVETLKYRGAGTVEFLVDKQSGDVVFLEVNARIQVEHPITEEAYGVDLVAAQLQLALGQEVELPDVAPVPAAAAFEIRINAEDPDNNFMPSPGTIQVAHFPSGPGIRVDSHVYDGYRFPPYYDSLLGKLIVRAHNRDAALRAVLAAVRQVRIEGIKTTLNMSEMVLAHPDFAAGGVSTTWFAPVWEAHQQEKK